MKYISLISLLFLTTTLSGQKESFEELLKSAKAYFAEPLETFFKKENIRNNSVIDFDYAMKGKQDPVDIRYKIIPVPEDSPIALAPQMKINSLAIHMASNDEEDLDMVFHRMDDEDIKPYNADFGMTVFFKPKNKISDRKHCKAIFLYAENKGLICTFIFFDNVRLDLKAYERNMTFSAGEL